MSTGTSTILKQGSKNSNDISTWVVGMQSSPPKDTLLAAAAATYVSPSDKHEILYHAATRFSPSGSATEGIWLFEQTVQVCTSGPNAGKALCGSDGATLAQHKIGDTFLFLSFTGSGFANVLVSTWQGADGPAGHLGPASGAIVVCPTQPDDACAVTNETSAITLGAPGGPQLPGTGFNVSGPGFAGFPFGVVPALQFEEGGVDLNSVLGGFPPCFSTIVFATVSSGSSPDTASLKAILFGNFNTCAISATKECGAGTAHVASSTITYPIMGAVTNIGGGTLQNVSLADHFENVPQPFDASPTCSCTVGGCTITGSDCTTAQVNPGSSVNYSASITTSENGGSDIIMATMGGTSGGSATAESNTAICNPITFPATVSVSKKCDPGASLVEHSGLVAVEVGVSGIVHNTSTNLPLSGVKVYDCVNGTFPPLLGSCATVNPDSCTGTLREVSTQPSSSIDANDTSPWSDTYFPSVAPSCGPYNFDDQVLVSASCTSPFCDCPTVQNVDSKTCPLCPGPTC